MAKVQHRSIYEIPELVKSNKLPPVIFLCGEDTFAIDGALKILIDWIEPSIGSEFDKEIISADKNSSSQNIIDLALAFPFGGMKKLIVVKDFNNLDEKNKFEELITDTPEYLHLILIQYGTVTATKTEPYASLHKNKLMFEAKKLKPDELADWLVKHAKKNNVVLSYENAIALTEIVGDEKSLLENQVNKMYDYVGEGGVLTFDVISSLASTTRKYTTFNLQDEIGKGNKSKALEIAINLLDSGTEMGQLIANLSRYFLLNMQSIELKSKRFELAEAAKEAGANFFYYKNTTNSKIYKNPNHLKKAAEALFKADLTLKTTSTDPKTVLTILISEMIPG